MSRISVEKVNIKELVILGRTVGDILAFRVINHVTGEWLGQAMRHGFKPSFAYAELVLCKI
jgi:hypothetical protein